MSGRRGRRPPPPVDVTVGAGVATLTLDRAQTGNRLDDAMMQGLVDAASAVADRDDCCAVVLRARGRVFSLGLPPSVGWPPSAWADGVAAIAALPMPVIAAVRGEARGWGMALALACDLRIVAGTAVFTLPEAQAGRLAGGGATQRLTRLVGAARAAEMLLLGRGVTGREAVAWGLASRALAAGQVEAAAERAARELARRGPLALRYAKEAVLRALDLPLADGIRLEHDLYVLLQTTADRREGVRAFLERRPPRFEAR
ncbi:MAG TPA: enoyl-CoA hydratase-related protein [Candidatus Limnocylindria bacterium]|nr:enoyl-CoA hydratase-related protein [Candidatus Limnocylindria bacterium]